MRLIILLLLSLNIAATNVIEVNKGNIDLIPVAINDIKAPANLNGLAKKINKTIQDDLENSQVFNVINPAAFIENKLGVYHTPLFAAWQQINANILLNTDLIKLADNKYEISYIIWDCFLGEIITSDKYKFSFQAHRRIAHKIADQIYYNLTGNKGYFDTQIAYISETGDINNRIKRLAVMDYDGHNHKFLSDDKNLVVTPRFSPNGKYLLYVSYANNSPQIFLKEIYSAKNYLLGDFPGMSFAPAFHPSKDKILISLANDGATNIFEFDLNSKQTKQLTFSKNRINTSPSYSPNGKEIVFNSDRIGTRQLFLMNEDGSNIRKLSKGYGSFTAPEWSPRGDYIAYTKIVPGEGFHIGIMRPNGDGERLLAKGYLTENASWAPNGRLIIYTKEEEPKNNKKGKTRLRILDINGFMDKELKTPLDASDPNWSNIRLSKI